MLHRNSGVSAERARALRHRLSGLRAATGRYRSSPETRSLPPRSSAPLDAAQPNNSLSTSHPPAALLNGNHLRRGQVADHTDAGGSWIQNWSCLGAQSVSCWRAAPGSPSRPATWWWTSKRLGMV